MTHPAIDSDTALESDSAHAGFSPSGNHRSAPETPPVDDVEALKQLPKEVGVMLMTVGVMGLVLPGVVGTPAVIVGGLVLWPKTFSKMENWFRGRCPDFHKKGVIQMKRYIADLEKRYPEADPQ
jgi:hypothetical protein